MKVNKAFTFPQTARPVNHNSCDLDHYHNYCLQCQPRNMFRASPNKTQDLNAIILKDDFMFASVNSMSFRLVGSSLQNEW